MKLTYTLLFYCFRFITMMNFFLERVGGANLTKKSSTLWPVETVYSKISSGYSGIWTEVQLLKIRNEDSTMLNITHISLGNAI